MMIQYKCRMCGETFNDAGGGEKSVSLGLQVAMHDFMKDMWQEPVGVPPTLLTMHHCKDGSFGVADLIGGKKD